MFQLKLCISNSLLILTLFFPAMSMAGGWSGNGGGTVNDVDNPWFVGGGEIPYCVIGNGRGVPTKSAIDLMIRRSAGKWTQFFARYGLNQPVQKLTRKELPQPGSHQIITRFQKADDCKAVEQFCHPDATDLDQCHSALADKVLFLIGKPNRVVENYIKFNGPVAGLAIRTDYNHNTLRSGGIVWVQQFIDGDWSKYEHLLLHEIGHVFGMKHDSCWVMNKDVVTDFDNLFKRKHLGVIESSFWPYSYVKGDVLQFTDFNISGFYANERFLNGIYPLMGFSKENSFRLQARIEGVSQHRLQMTLEFREEQTGKLVVFSGDLSTLKIVWDSPYVPSLYTQFRSSENQYEFYREPMFGEWVQGEHQGTLIWEGRRYPVTLIRDRGLFLSLYFPEAEKFFSIRTAID